MRNTIESTVEADGINQHKTDSTNWMIVGWNSDDAKCSVDLNRADIPQMFEILYHGSIDFLTVSAADEFGRSSASDVRSYRGVLQRQERPKATVRTDDIEWKRPRGR